MDNSTTAPASRPTSPKPSCKALASKLYDDLIVVEGLSAAMELLVVDQLAGDSDREMRAICGVTLALDRLAQVCVDAASQLDHRMSVVTEAA